MSNKQKPTADGGESLFRFLWEGPGAEKVRGAEKDSQRYPKYSISTSSKAYRMDGSNHENAVTCHSRATFGLHIICFVIVCDLLNPNVGGSLYVNVTFASRTSVLPRQKPSQMDLQLLGY
jgi:hypothetical protein